LVRRTIPEEFEERLRAMARNTKKTVNEKPNTHNNVHDGKAQGGYKFTKRLMAKMRDLGGSSRPVGEAKLKTFKRPLALSPIKKGPFGIENEYTHGWKFFQGWESKTESKQF